MLLFFILMAIILAFAAFAIAVVTMGMRGRGKSRYPNLSRRLERVATYVEGDTSWQSAKSLDDELFQESSVAA